MSLDFHPKGTPPKRSARKILERIIPTRLGGRGELHFVCFTTALRTWYNSSSKLQCTLFLKLVSHYQLGSLKINYTLQGHRRINLAVIGRHGVIDPVNIQSAKRNTAIARISVEYTTRQNILHLHGQTKNG